MRGDQFAVAGRAKKSLQHCCCRLFVLVRLAGIEPTTPWFVAKYSIQLSYSREARIVAWLLDTFFGRA